MKKNACSFVLLTVALLAFAVLWSDGLLAAEPLGTAVEARAMLDRAVVALKADRGKALAAFNDAHNKDFRDRDLFVYCFDTADGKFTAYEMSALVGADIRQFKLYNEPMGQRSYDVVHDAPEGAVVTIDYQMPKPGRPSRRPKKPSKPASAIRPAGSVISSRKAREWGGQRRQRVRAKRGPMTSSAPCPRRDTRKIRVGFAELVIGPATSGRTRWLSPPYCFPLTNARETCRTAST